MLLSTLTVDSLDDSGAGSGTSGDLRYCITEANLSAGSSINFSVTGTIQLTKALPALSANVTIDGPGATSLTIEGGGTSSNYSVLTIKKGVTATISGLTTSGGHSTSNGGGIDNLGTMTLTDCTVSNDSALTGGGIFNTGTMTLTGCTVSHVAGKYGGGVTNYIGGNAVIIASTIAKNTAVNQGGGISTYGPLKLINSTVEGNAAASAGGIYVDAETGSTTMTNCTITGNRETGAGGGGIHAFGPTTLYNTIVCGNFGGAAPSTTPNDIAGSVNTTTSSNNLVGKGGSGGLADGSNGNLVGITNPGLGTLGDNGGPTQTIPLLAGSPAIDAGNNAKALDASGQPLTTDQRGFGFPRIQGARVDIGAFEFTPAPALTPVTITWPDPADIVYGTVLESTQLDATASATVDGSTVIVPGTFTYSPTASTLLNAGNDQILSVSFTPTDSTDYTGATATVNINVDQATPELGANPVDLTYGTPLANSQLTGMATWTVAGNGITVPGTWSYTSAAGTVLEAGNDQNESVTFTPTDSVDYSSTTATVTVNVSPAAPNASVNPVNLTYGTALANSQLTGTATWTVGGNVLTVPGTWSYSSAAGAVLSAGAGQSESVTFTPTDSVDYTSTTAMVTVNVTRAVLDVSVNPVNLTYGTLLSDSQLGGTATWTVGGNAVKVAGSWSYAGVAGRVLSAGSDQSEPVTFTPADATDYSPVITTAVINVSPAPLTITADNETKTYGSVFTSETDFTTSGLVSDDTVTSVTLTSPGAVATADVSGSPYSIIPSDAAGTGLSNYSIVYQTGTLTVTTATPVISVLRDALSVNPSFFGQSVTFDATVTLSASSPITPMGAVSLYDGNPSAGGLKIGSPQSLSGGRASITIKGLSVSTAGHAIYAVYTPATSQSADINGVTSLPIEQTVNADQTAVSVSSSPNPGKKGKPVTITALVLNKSVPGGGAPVGTVVFIVDGRRHTIALSPSGKAVLSGVKLAVGRYTVTVLYTPGKVDFRSSQSSLTGGQVVKR